MRPSTPGSIEKRIHATDMLREAQHTSFFCLMGVLEHAIEQGQIQNQTVINYVQKINAISDDLTSVASGEQDENLDEIVARHCRGWAKNRRGGK